MCWLLLLPVKSPLKKSLSYQVDGFLPISGDVLAMSLDQVLDAGLPNDELLVAVEGLELDDVAEVHLK